MANILQLEKNIKEIIDELKGACQPAGISGQAAEEVVITSIFLYKFLNDKFMWNLENFSKNIKLSKEDILKNKNDSLDAFYHTYGEDVAFEKEDTIEELAKKINEPNFYEKLDDVLEHISSNPRNEIFSVETAGGERKALFTRITENVEMIKRNNFAKSIFASIAQHKFDFGEAFEDNFDFYSTIFEYLIKDYNTQSSRYADYFTPQAVSNIIAKILVKMSPVKDTIYEIYDPSAGSGSLVLHLANELGNGSFGNKARVFTQDISQKSTRFLRLNILLNGLTESLDNIIEGDSMTMPAHFMEKGNPNSGLKTFDYITANPPFKMDFSSTRDIIANTWSSSGRFFAGVPKIKAKDRTKMEIYLCFIQHILYSLKDDGKAAIVVPTGFITAKNGIEKKIREKIIDKKWLKGVISMPSNIFANTGTNVSILFIDKTNCSKKSDVILIDASKMGHDEKSGKISKTVLDENEMKKIENYFIKKVEEKGFSIKVKYDDIVKNNYYLSANQYFETVIEYVSITKKEFEKMISDSNNSISKLSKEINNLERKILKQNKELKFNEIK